MRSLPLALLLLLAVGCAHQTARPPGDGAALAQAQQLGEIAMTTLQEDGPLGVKVALRTLHTQSDKFQLAITDYFAMSMESNHAIDERNQARQDLKQERGRFFSAIQRRLWWVALSIWAGLGMAAILLGVFGLAGPSALIMRALPFSNPFAWIRDRIMKARGTDTNVSVTVTSVPAQAVEVTPALRQPKPRKKGK